MPSANQKQPDEITAELDRLQTLIQPADDAIAQLSTLVRSHEGPLFDAVGRLTDELVRRVAASINADYDLLQDWWLTHQFGATPMAVIIDGGPARQLHNNADMAAFLVEIAQ